MRCHRVTTVTSTNVVRRTFVHEEAVKKLADRMKTFEQESKQRVLERNLPCIVRLDGHSFSKFTKGFEKPFDRRIHTAMIKTAKDLIHEFNCTTAYTESDEISLIFPPFTDNSVFPYGGRIDKLISIAAGLCSARFNHYLREFDSPQLDEKLRKRITGSLAFFDARAFSLPDDLECRNNILWRSLDCKRNSISLLGVVYFPQKQLTSKPTHQVIKMLAEKGVHWDKMPKFYKFGTFVKKRNVLKEGVDPRTGATSLVNRTEFGFIDAELIHKWDSPSVMRFLCDKVITKETFPTIYDSLLPTDEIKPELLV